MLRQILSPETCAECRICCGFDASDLWELPVLPPETVNAVTRHNDKLQFVSAGEEQVFDAPDLSENELFPCPMCSDTGCIMGDEKPFDCKVWPFRLMQDTAGALHIAVASYCPGIKQYTDQQLRAFLEQGLGQTMLTYAKSHPAHIKPFSADYRILL